MGGCGISNFILCVLFVAKTKPFNRYSYDNILSHFFIFISGYFAA